MRRLRDSALRFAPSSDDLCTWNEAIGAPIFKSLQESLCLLSCTVLDAGTNKALDHSASQYCLAGVASQIQRGPPAQVLAPKSCLATKRPSVATKACVPIKEKRKKTFKWQSGPVSWRAAVGSTPATWRASHLSPMRHLLRSKEP